MRSRFILPGNATSIIGGKYFGRINNYRFSRGFQSYSTKFPISRIRNQVAPKPRPAWLSTDALTSKLQFLPDFRAPPSLSNSTAFGSSSLLKVLSDHEVSPHGSHAQRSCFGVRLVGSLSDACARERYSAGLWRPNCHPAELYHDPCVLYRRPVGDVDELPRSHVLPWHARGSRRSGRKHRVLCQPCVEHA